MSDTPHATFQAPAPEQLAPLFPGYKIEDLIATGGMGAVYRAVQLSLDRTVAIKILPREFGADDSFRGSFESEAKAMARLNHPNLIGVYDFGEVDGMLYILMEFVPCKSLFHSAYGKAIAPLDAARIVSEVCHGLAHAHEAHIIHRDIKPGNILLDAQSRPKIGDFGLARPINRKVEDGETIFGTPHYTAPEVVSSPQSVDARADIFSIGVVLHELLTGKLPNDDPRPPSTIVACDPRFDSIVRRATHPSPELRYHSAAEMASDLDAIRNSQPAASKLRTAAPAAARPGVPAIAPLRSPRPLSSASSESSATPVVLAGLGVAAAVGIALFMILGKSEPEPQTTSTETTSTETTTITPPTPEPQPDPEPTPTPEPEPDPEPEIVEVEPDPEPEPEVADNEPEEKTDEPMEDKTDDATTVVSTPPKVTPPAIPTFDVIGFLDRARAIMRQRAIAPIDEHASAISDNFDRFERGIKRAVRRLDNDRRPAAEIASEERLETWRSDGNRVPKDLKVPNRDDRDMRGFFEDLDQVHAEFYSKQKLIDQALDQEITALRDLYILGIQKEIGRRREVSDTISIEALEEEITLTRDEPERFRAAMEGRVYEPKSDDEDDEDDEDEEDEDDKEEDEED
jgi:serine/threonine protein kinase